jgi:signal transduction histidine kinase
LQTINLATSALREGSVGPESRGIRAIDSAVTRMEALIARLLDLAALDRGGLELRRTPCEVRGLVEAAAAHAELRARAGEIELISASVDGIVEVDRDRIMQVLSNLIDNALKHTPAGGRIEVRATLGDHARFEVRDTGPGIAHAQLAQVFQRYWRGSGLGRGSLGLGLYICKNVVTAHGGEIGVDSELGRGTTFWFTVPTEATAAARPT